MYIAVGANGTPPRGLEERPKQQLQFLDVTDRQIQFLIVFGRFAKVITNFNNALAMILCNCHDNASTTLSLKLRGAVIQGWRKWILAKFHQLQHPLSRSIFGARQQKTPEMNVSDQQLFNACLLARNEKVSKKLQLFEVSNKISKIHHFGKLAETVMSTTPSTSVEIVGRRDINAH